jgi:hypothetical protein
VKISTGTPETHETPLPLDAAASPAVAPPTPVFAAGHEQGGVLTDTSGVDFTADAAAAMAAGMSADADRRGRYLASMEPLGASAGDLLPVSNPPLDPGVPGGETEPWGALFDPPRGA